MSLYDIMNRKPVEGKTGVVEQPKPVELVAAPVVVTEEKAPVVPVQTAPVQEAPQAVQSTETPQKKPYTHWWQTPEYLGEVERRAASAEKRAEQDRKRAVRQRNAAILGDLAKLGAQMYAKKGGAWKIDAFTPVTERANDKLAALRERHAAEVAAFAKERAAARQAQIADNNARMKLETSLAEADAERARRAATEKANQDYRERTLKNEEDRIAIAKQNANTAAEKAAAGRASGGSGANKNYIRVFMPNGESKTYNKGTHGDTWINRAYEEAKRAGMPKCTKTVTVRDEYGVSTTKEVEETSLPKLKAWIEEWSYNNELGGGNTQGWDDSGINEELIDEDFK